jgi:hypothetical protein
MDGVEALVFDVFGTTVDWRSTVEQELKDLSKKYSLGESVHNRLKFIDSLDLILFRAVTNADWAEFAQEWRTGYMDGT